MTRKDEYGPEVFVAASEGQIYLLSSSFGELVTPDGNHTSVFDKVKLHLASDIFISSNKEIIIADTGRRRVIMLKNDELTREIDFNSSAESLYDCRFPVKSESDDSGNVLVLAKPRISSDNFSGARLFLIEKGETHPRAFEIKRKGKSFDILSFSVAQNGQLFITPVDANLLYVVDRGGNAEQWSGGEFGRLLEKTDCWYKLSEQIPLASVVLCVVIPILIGAYSMHRQKEEAA